MTARKSLVQVAGVMQELPSGDTILTTQMSGDIINAATNKATPIDGDYVGLMDSTASNILRKLSWANIKTTLKAYFDMIYPSIPLVQVIKSAAYTFVLTDAGLQYLHPSADTTARTWTIPANSSVAFPIGTGIVLVNQNGAGVITLAITTDTMRLASSGSTGSRSLAANGVATATKITSTEWFISGVGLT